MSILYISKETGHFQLQDWNVSCYRSGGTHIVFVPAIILQVCRSHRHILFSGKPLMTRDCTLSEEENIAICCKSMIRRLTFYSTWSVHKAYIDLLVYVHINDQSKPSNAGQLTFSTKLNLKIFYLRSRNPIFIEYTASDTYLKIERNRKLTIKTW